MENHIRAALTAGLLDRHVELLLALIDNAAIGIALSIWPMASVPKFDYPETKKKGSGSPLRTIGRYSRSAACGPSSEATEAPSQSRSQDRISSTDS